MPAPRKERKKTMSKVAKRTIRTVFKKVMWVGRATTFCVGLAVVLALTAGLASTAPAGTGVGARFDLGKTNAVNAVSKLVGGVAGPNLRIDNNSTSTDATALDLRVESGKPPMKVNSDTKVASLNADQIDDKDSTEFATGVDGKATDADKLDGKDASQLPGAITDYASFYGLVTSIAGNNDYYVFAGPTDSVTVADGQRLFGAAEAPLGLTSGSPLQSADVGLCYQPNGNGPILNFLGANFSVHNFTTTRQSYAATAATTLPAGTYSVGMCVRNNGPGPITNNNYVNGWVQVVNPTS